MNVITVAGVLGKDAEMKYMQSGDAVASFSVAESQGRDKTLWWSCSIWGKRAETLSAFLTKGTKVTVSGQVTEDVWTDKNGQERKSMKVRVNDIALQSKRESHDEPQERRQAPAPQSSFDDDDGSDVPF